MYTCCICRDVVTCDEGGGEGGREVVGYCPYFNFRNPTVSVSTSSILLFMCVQKLYGSEVSQFLPFLLSFLGNLRRFSSFSNYIGEIDHFILNTLKRSDTCVGPTEIFLIDDHPKDTTIKDLQLKIKNQIMAYR